MAFMKRLAKQGVDMNIAGGAKPATNVVQVGKRAFPFRGASKGGIHAKRSVRAQRKY